MLITFVVVVACSALPPSVPIMLDVSCKQQVVILLRNHWRPQPDLLGSIKKAPGPTLV